MILTDYLRSDYDVTWDFALQSGITHGVIRLPEDDAFDLTDASHWISVYKKFTDFGIKPIVIEPMPNELHDHIKTGDKKRDWAIENVIKMFPIMRNLDINTICFNWMAHIGWLRTSSDFIERGGARVTEFNISDFKPAEARITADVLWDNYTYFIKAVIPESEKYGIKLALHPDDPPIERLGNVERIMISKANIKKAVYDIVKSDNLGITMCQATYFIMGEDLIKTIEELAQKIFFVHFRNTKGIPTHFRETFHDNGDINMAEVLKTYIRCGVNVPIRADHVPTLKGEKSSISGYDALGRLYAIGYLKGLLQASEI